MNINVVSLLKIMESNAVSLLKIMDINVVSYKLKVYHSLTSSGTFVIYIVHQMWLMGC